MLREIHGSVGDLDEFMRRSAVERITSDAETGADIFFAKKRIGGDPTAELRGELAGLLHGGFGHQDDELVAAVAGDDIGAAAIGFENLADALENEVTFKVAVEIVDEFEAVEVHEYERERAAGAGRGFPFGREGVHKKTGGF